MKTKVLLLITLLFAGTLSAAESWETDFAKASETAKKEGKFMILNFTGSDWCHWCIRLEREIFSKEAFKTYAGEKLVPVMLDFPRRKKQDAALVTQNRGLQAKYKIRGFPTVIVLNSDGELVGRTGYRPGGPEAYVKHLEEMIAPHRKGGNKVNNGDSEPKGE